MPRNPSQQRSIATVNAIIKAGFICVAEKGLAATTTRHIAAVAGVGVGSVYEYFKNKEAIYSAMAARFIEDLSRMITELTPGLTEQPVEEVLRILLASFREFLQKEDSLYLRYAREAPPTQFREYQHPITKTLIELMMQYLVKHPELAQVKNIQGTSYFLINGGSYAVMNHLLDPSPPISFEELVDAIAKMVDSYVKVSVNAGDA